MQLLEKALEAYDRGWSVIPVKCVYDEEKGKVKKPASVRWLKFRDEKPERKLLMTEWRNKLNGQPGLGYGIICGPISNLFVVDVDTEEANQAVIDHMGDAETYMVKTPSGGYHYYFYHTDGFENWASIGITGLDIRTYGGYVVGPGGSYPDGTKYEIFKDKEIIRIPTELRSFILSHVIEKQEQGRKKNGQGSGDGLDSNGNKTKNEDWFTEILRVGFTEGQRVDQLKRVVGYLVHEQREEEYIRNLVELINRISDPPLSDQELSSQTNSMIKSFKGKELALSDELEERVKSLNSRYAQITLGGKPMIMRFFENEDGFEDYDLLQPAAMKAETKHYTEWVGKRKFYLYQLWEESEYRRRYQDIIFDPNQEPQTHYLDGDNGRYNLWGGFTFEPKKGDWSLFRKHIEEVMAPGYGDYVLTWLARMFQDPGGRRPGKVLVFRGKPGTGKSFTRKMIGRFFGKHFYKTDDINHLIGKFNNAVSNVIFLALEEAMWAGDKSQVGRLKERVTSKTISIEKKGIDVINVDSHLNIMMNSNEKWVVPIQDSDRRFVVFDVSDKYAENQEYFQAIEDQMENGGFEAMLYDMLNWEYKWQDLMDSPKTSAAFDQLTREKDSIKQFALHCLTKGVLHPIHNGWKSVIIKEKLYESYTRFCNLGRYTYIESEHSFFKDICKYIPMDGGKRKRFGKRGTGGTGKSRQQVSVFMVPALDNCRNHFSKGFEYTWEEPMIEDILSDSEREKDFIDIYNAHIIDETPF